MCVHAEEVGVVHGVSFRGVRSSQTGCGVWPGLCSSGFVTTAVG